MKKPAADTKTCASCESYKPLNPGDEAGYCHLTSPVWVECTASAGREQRAQMAQAAWDG